VRATTARGGRHRQQAKSQMGVIRGLARDKQTAIRCDIGQALAVVLDSAVAIHYAEAGRGQLLEAVALFPVKTGLRSRQ